MFDSDDGCHEYIKDPSDLRSPGSSKRKVLLSYEKAEKSQRRENRPEREQKAGLNQTERCGRDRQTKGDRDRHRREGEKERDVGGLEVGWWVGWREQMDATKGAGGYEHTGDRKHPLVPAPRTKSHRHGQRETGEETDRQIRGRERQTDRQIRGRERQTNRQIRGRERQKDRQRGGRERQTDREGAGRDRQTDRQTERGQGETERQTEKGQGGTDRQGAETDRRDNERQTARETETVQRSRKRE